MAEMRVSSHEDIDELFKKQAARTAVAEKTYSKGMIYFVTGCAAFSLVGQIFLMTVMNQRFSPAGWSTVAFTGLIAVSTYARRQLFTKGKRRGR